jgi:hypothetical protein
VTNEKRDEAECPTCRRNNDRGVSKCWNCSRPDPYPAPSDPLTCGDDWSSALMNVGPGSFVVSGLGPPVNYPQTQTNGLGGYALQPFAPPNPVSLQIDRSEMTLLAEGLLGNAERLVNFDPAEALRLIDRAREIVEKLR